MPFAIKPSVPSRMASEKKMKTKSQKVLKIVRKMFKKPSSSKKANPSRTLASTKHRLLAESAVWRNDVERLCADFDNGGKGDESVEKYERIRAIRRRTQEYRDELHRLKQNARVLKQQRNMLYNHVQYNSFASSGASTTSIRQVLNTSSSLE